jgi:hypothetical protein
MAFDYESEETKQVDVSSVADAIRSSQRLAPLTDEQKIQRRIQQEIYREEQAWKAEQRRAKRERLVAQRAEASRREAAIANEQARQKYNRELLERQKERQRETDILDLKIKTGQATGWITGVENNARIGQYFRQRQALVDELDAIVNPPPTPEPETEPEPVYPENPKIGDPDFYAKWNARRPLRSWY